MKFDEQTIIDLDDRIERWEEYMYFELNPNFAEALLGLREGMQPRVQIPQLDMMTYKKSIIADITKDYNLTLDFTDEELEQNRILNGEHKNTKITKYISNKLSERHKALREQKLDFFNKLRTADNEYYIDSDPSVILEAYLAVRTCLSPGGENQSNLIKFLASPYVYIAVDKRYSSRMMIYADWDRKIAFFHRVYGNYDYMFALSVVKYYIDNGFVFANHLYDAFDDGEGDFISYRDSDENDYTHHIDFFGGEYGAMPEVDLWKQPSWYHSHVDMLSGKRMKGHHYTTFYNFHDSASRMLPEGEEYCTSCQDIVRSDDYDFDWEMCNYCSNDHNYCEYCGENHPSESYNFDENMCNGCYADRFTFCEKMSA